MRTRLELARGGRHFEQLRLLELIRDWKDAHRIHIAISDDAIRMAEVRVSPDAQWTPDDVIIREPVEGFPSPTLMAQLMLLLG